VGHVPIGQAPQAIAYVPRAVPGGGGAANLQPLGVAGDTAKLALGANGEALTAVTLFDQGLTQILQAAVTGLKPKQAYQLVLAPNEDGSGESEPLADFVANPAGSAIVNAVGPIRQIVAADTAPATRRWLAIRERAADGRGRIVQVQQRP
jgi:hypothetical protein